MQTDWTTQAASVQSSVAASQINFQPLRVSAVRQPLYCILLCSFCEHAECPHSCCAGIDEQCIMPHKEIILPWLCKPAACLISPSSACSILDPHLNFLAHAKLSSGGLLHCRAQFWVVMPIQTLS